jgi:hypothetical protein
MAHLMVSNHSFSGDELCRHMFWNGVNTYLATLTVTGEVLRRLECENLFPDSSMALLAFLRIMALLIICVYSE